MVSRVALVVLAPMLFALTFAWVAQAEIIYLPTEQGAQRFRRSAAEPEALSLIGFADTEARQSFCGPTSLAAALNSLGLTEPTPAPMFPYHLVTQDTLFTPENQAVKSYAAVERDGLTLDQLGKFAANMHVTTQVIHAADLTAKELRSRLRAALGAPATRVIINYSRIPLGQVGDGHISPLVAYDAESDSFLVMDVARYNYPPAWISFDQLQQAMLRVDSDSELSRGALIIFNPGPTSKP